MTHNATRGRGAPALALVLTTLWVACGDEAPVVSAPVAQPVKIMEFRSSGVVRMVEYPGKISATRRAEVAFEVSGRIVELPVTEGQKVEEGEVLARLDPRDFESKLAEENAQAAAALAEFNRQKVLFEKHVASRQTYDRALRSYQVTAARIETAEKAVGDAVLRAPFAGRVARVFVDEFQNIEAKQPIATLQVESGLQIEVAVPERDAVGGSANSSLEERTARLRPVVRLSSLPDREFPAQITEFTTEADPVTRTFSATLVFDVPEDVNVLPGMTASVRIEAQSRTGGGALILASAALADDSGEAFVWLVDPSSMTVQRRRVELGELSGSDVAIRGGLEDGDQIAISGVHQLRDGMAVRRFEN